MVGALAVVGIIATLLLLRRPPDITEPVVEELPFRTIINLIALDSPWSTSFSGEVITSELELQLIAGLHTGSYPAPSLPPSATHPDYGLGLAQWVEGVDFNTQFVVIIAQNRASNIAVERVRWDSVQNTVKIDVKIGEPVTPISVGTRIGSPTNITGQLIAVDKGAVSDTATYLFYERGYVIFEDRD